MPGSRHKHPSRRGELFFEVLLSELVRNVEYASSRHQVGSRFCNIYFITSSSEQSQCRTTSEKLCVKSSSET
jgi:hypothetical protein